MLPSLCLPYTSPNTGEPRVTVSWIAATCYYWLCGVFLWALDLKPLVRADENRAFSACCLRIHRCFLLCSRQSSVAACYLDLSIASDNDRGCFCTLLYELCQIVVRTLCSVKLMVLVFVIWGTAKLFDDVTNIATAQYFHSHFFLIVLCVVYTKLTNAPNNAIGVPTVLRWWALSLIGWD
jgi:hypothetical protein